MGVLGLVVLTVVGAPPPDKCPAYNYTLTGSQALETIATPGVLTCPDRVQVTANTWNCSTAIDVWCLEDYVHGSTAAAWETLHWPGTMIELGGGSPDNLPDLQCSTRNRDTCQTRPFVHASTQCPSQMYSNPLRLDWIYPTQFVFGFNKTGVSVTARCFDDVMGQKWKPWHAPAPAPAPGPAPSHTFVCVPRPADWTWWAWALDVYRAVDLRLFVLGAVLRFCGGRVCTFFGKFVIVGGQLSSSFALNKALDAITSRPAWTRDCLSNASLWKLGCIGVKVLLVVCVFMCFLAIVTGVIGAVLLEVVDCIRATFRCLPDDFLSAVQEFELVTSLFGGVVIVGAIQYFMVTDMLFCETPDAM